MRIPRWIDLQIQARFFTHGAVRKCPCRSIKQCVEVWHIGGKQQATRREMQHTLRDATPMPTKDIPTTPANTVTRRNVLCAPGRSALGLSHTTNTMARKRTLQNAFPDLFLWVRAKPSQQDGSQKRGIPAGLRHELPQRPPVLRCTQSLQTNATAASTMCAAGANRPDNRSHAPTSRQHETSSSFAFARIQDNTLAHRDATKQQDEGATNE